MKQRLLLATLASAALLSSCKKEENHDALKQAVVDSYAEMVYASYEDSHHQATIFQTMVDEFVDTPTEAEFNALKTFWSGPLRSSYGQTDAFRFYGGPIDDDNGREGQMNAWPLDEVYIDYVDGNPNAGIINDAVGYPSITIDVIKGANENGGETNISTGYHAIEFLLWGQDLYTNSAGLRPYTDYTTAGNAGRRKQYLKAATDLLSQDLAYTKNAWATSAPYRSTFVSQGSDISLELMLTGIGKFCKGELFGERFEVAYSTQSQEDEHSCFSDQTHNDLRMGFVGIENVYFGRYTKVDGTTVDGEGLDELLEAINPTLNSEIKAKLQTAHDAVFALHAPFDQEIVTSDGRARCVTAIAAGNEVADKIVEAATALGIQITL